MEQTCIDKDTDYLGDDIPPMDGMVRWSECKDQCDKEDLCRYWTFKISGECFLKERIFGVITQVTTISGAKQCPGKITPGKALDHDSIIVLLCSTYIRQNV